MKILGHIASIKAMRIASTNLELLAAKNAIEALRAVDLYVVCIDPQDLPAMEEILGTTQLSLEMTTALALAVDKQRRPL